MAPLLGLDSQLGQCWDSMSAHTPSALSLFGWVACNKLEHCVRQSVDISRVPLCVYQISETVLSFTLDNDLRIQ